MRKFILGAAVAALVATPAIVLQSSASADDAGALQETGEQQFVVVYTEGVSVDAAHAAIEAAGGTIVAENTDVGVATVVTTNGDFAAAADAAGRPRWAPPRTVSSAPPPISSSTPARARSSIRPRPTCSSRAVRPSQRPRRRTPRTERRAARRPAVGHAADRRHRRRLVQVRAGQEGRAGRDHRHRCRRLAPRHRAQLQRRS